MATRTPSLRRVLLLVLCKNSTCNATFKFKLKLIRLSLVSLQFPSAVLSVHSMPPKGTGSRKSSSVAAPAHSKGKYY